MSLVEIISATRHPAETFWGSALGFSLRRLSFDQGIKSRIAIENTRGLPLVYNERIAAARDDSIVLMIHDDVWIDDYFLRQRLLEGLAHYDLVGLVGNRRRLAGQPNWAFVNDRFETDDPAHLSGSIAHGKMPFGRVNNFGECPAECELLDGVFLAARKSVLLEHDVRFDARFDFHFYDLDICRSARKAGMRIGTWPICVTHQSGGEFGTDSWRAGYRAYLDKWGS